MRNAFGDVEGCVEAGGGAEAVVCAVEIGEAVSEEDGRQQVDPATVEFLMSGRTE